MSTWRSRHVEFSLKEGLSYPKNDFLNLLTLDGGGSSPLTLVLSPGVEGLMRSEEMARSQG